MMVEDAQIIENNTNIRDNVNAIKTSKNHDEIVQAVQSILPNNHSITATTITTTPTSSSSTTITTSSNNNSSSSNSIRDNITKSVITANQSFDLPKYQQQHHLQLYQNQQQRQLQYSNFDYSSSPVASSSSNSTSYQQTISNSHHERSVTVQPNISNYQHQQQQQQQTQWPNISSVRPLNTDDNYTVNTRLAMKEMNEIWNDPLGTTAVASSSPSSLLPLQHQQQQLATIASGTDMIKFKIHEDTNIQQTSFTSGSASANSDIVKRSPFTIFTDNDNQDVSINYEKQHQQQQQQQQRLPLGKVESPPQFTSIGRKINDTIGDLPLSSSFSAETTGIKLPPQTDNFNDTCTTQRFYFQLEQKQSYANASDSNSNSNSSSSIGNRNNIKPTSTPFHETKKIPIDNNEIDIQHQQQQQQQDQYRKILFNDDYDDNDVSINEQQQEKEQQQLQQEQQLVLQQQLQQQQQQQQHYEGSLQKHGKLSVIFENSNEYRYSSSSGSRTSYSTVSVGGSLFKTTLTGATTPAPRNASAFNRESLQAIPEISHCNYYFNVNDTNNFIDKQQHQQSFVNDETKTEYSNYDVLQNLLTSDDNALNTTNNMDSYPSDRQLSYRHQQSDNNNDNDDDDVNNGGNDKRQQQQQRLFVNDDGKNEYNNYDLLKSFLTNDDNLPNDANNMNSFHDRQLSYRHQNPNDDDDIDDAIDYDDDINDNQKHQLQKQQQQHQQQQQQLLQQQQQQEQQQKQISLLSNYESPMKNQFREMHCDSNSSSNDDNITNTNNGTKPVYNCNSFIAKLQSPPSDPFSIKLHEKLLSKINFPSANYSRQYVPMVTLPKLIPKKDLAAFNDDKYLIEKVIGKGAFGCVYKATHLSTNQTVALKYQKPGNKWEYYIIKEIHQRLTNLNMTAAFMDVNICYISRSASVLVSDYWKIGSLLDVTNKVKQNTGKCMKELLAIYYASDIMTIVNTLHKQCNVIHGDIKPDNFLVTRLPPEYGHPSLQLIDFGRSIDMTLFPAGTTFKSSVNTENFICTEMKEGRPWNYQTDIFCVAATIHVLLFDKYMQLQKTSAPNGGSVWSISQHIPRYMRSDLWKTFFFQMLNIDSCNQLPNLLEIKSIFDTILSSQSEDLKMEMKAMANIVLGR